MGAVATVDSYIFAPPRPSSYDVDHRHFVRTGPHHGAFLVNPPETSERSRGALIYLHANACDCNRCYHEISILVRKTCMPVLAPEYPGYGPLDGPPSIEGVNEAVHCGYQYVRDILGVQPAHIVLYGRSLGTGAALHLAKELALRKDHVGAVVLLSPFNSLARLVGEKCVGWKAVASPLASLLARNMWDNGDALSTLHCPTLILHGEEDPIIPVKHAVDLVERNPLAEAKYVASWKHNMNVDELRTAVALTCEFLRDRTKAPVHAKEPILYYDGSTASARRKCSLESPRTNCSGDDSDVPAMEFYAPLSTSQNISPRFLPLSHELCYHAPANVVQEDKQNHSDVAPAVRLDGWAAARYPVEVAHELTVCSGTPLGFPLRVHSSPQPGRRDMFAFSAPSVHTSQPTASPFAASRAIGNAAPLPAQPFGRNPHHTQRLNEALRQHQMQERQEQRQRQQKWQQQQQRTSSRTRPFEIPSLVGAMQADRIEPFKRGTWNAWRTAPTTTLRSPRRQHANVITGEPSRGTSIALDGHVLPTPKPSAGGSMSSSAAPNWQHVDSSSCPSSAWAASAGQEQSGEAATINVLHNLWGIKPDHRGLITRNALQYARNRPAAQSPVFLRRHTMVDGRRIVWDGPLHSGHVRAASVRRCSRRPQLESATQVERRTSKIGSECMSRVLLGQHHVEEAAHECDRRDAPASSSITIAV